MEDKKANLIISEQVLNVLDSVAITNEAEAWQCVKMLYYYIREGKTPDKKDVIKNIVFHALKNMLDEGKTRYEKCITNGKKGGRPKEKKEAKTEVKEYLSQEEELAIFERLKTDKDFLSSWLDYSPFGGSDMACYRDEEDFENFFNECQFKEKRHTSENDIKAHFLDWERIQLQNRKNEWKKGRYR